MNAPQFIGEIDSDTMGLDGHRGRLRLVAPRRPQLNRPHYDEFDGGYDEANLSGLGKNPLKKLGKAVKKVVKSKPFKIVAGAAALYYGGGAVKKALKSKGIVSKVKKASKIKSAVKKVGKFAKKHKKELIGAGVVGAAALATGGNKPRMVKDPFTGEAVNYDTLNPAMKDRVLMQQGSQVNSNGVPFGSGQTENPAFAAQKIDVPQSAPFEYAKPTQAQESTASNLFDRFTNAQSARSGTYDEGGQPQAGQDFAGSIDPKFLLIGGVALAALFLMGRKRG